MASHRARDRDRAALLDELWRWHRPAVQTDDVAPQGSPQPGETPVPSTAHRCGWCGLPKRRGALACPDHLDVERDYRRQTGAL